MQRIGFIGLGIMGAPMAANLLTAGYPLTVHNRSRGAVEDLCGDGAVAAGSARELAAGSDVVITMLPDSPDVEDVVLGSDGVLEGIAEGALYIDMSTIAPSVSRRLADVLSQRGVDAIDAPVSGGEPAARAGELSIMCGGSEAAVQRARAVFDVLGKATTHIGPAGAGQVTKAANQMVVALTIQAVAEALTLSRKAGVDPERVREALLGGFAQSRILDLHGQRMIDGAHDPGFKLHLHRKDLAIAQQLGREVNMPLLATAQAAGLMDALLAQGAADRDHSALVLAYQQLAAVAEPVGA
ncbi:MAG: 2-hydroxy-3-oxopropionate reductase [Solirubrobacteraceae bacterium]